MKSLIDFALVYTILYLHEERWWSADHDILDSLCRVSVSDMFLVFFGTDDIFLFLVVLNVLTVGVSSNITTIWCWSFILSLRNSIWNSSFRLPLWLLLWVRSKIFQETSNTSWSNKLTSETLEPTRRRQIPCKLKIWIHKLILILT